MLQVYHKLFYLYIEYLNTPKAYIITTAVIIYAFGVYVKTLQTKKFSAARASFSQVFPSFITPNYFIGLHQYRINLPSTILPNNK